MIVTMTYEVLPRLPMRRKYWLKKMGRREEPLDDIVANVNTRHEVQNISDAGGRAARRPLCHELRGEFVHGDPMHLEQGIRKFSKR